MGQKPFDFLEIGLGETTLEPGRFRPGVGEKEFENLDGETVILACKCQPPQQEMVISGRQGTFPVKPAEEQQQGGLVIEFRCAAKGQSHHVFIVGIQLELFQRPVERLLVFSGTVGPPRLPIQLLGLLAADHPFRVLAPGLLFLVALLLFFQFLVGRHGFSMKNNRVDGVPQGFPRPRPVPSFHSTFAEMMLVFPGGDSLV